MDNIILGLLLLSSRTIYQLRERIDKGLNMMYSSSMGSIQAAIKKLLNCGYIQYEEAVENGKYKKIYSYYQFNKFFNNSNCFYSYIFSRKHFITIINWITCFNTININ